MIFVVGDICGVKTSNSNIIGSLFTNTNDLSGVNPVRGINGVGGHQQVLSFISIVNGMGGLPQGC